MNTETVSNAVLAFAGRVQGCTATPDSDKKRKRVDEPTSVEQPLQKARTLNRDLISDSSLALVQDWIKQCEANHVVCNTEGLGENPKRLIDVGDEENIKLVRAEVDHRYIALSHCWGKGTPLKTLRSSEADRKVSIRWDELPLSYQDAVKVTRWLGIRYL